MQTRTLIFAPFVRYSNFDFRVDKFDFALAHAIWRIFSREVPFRNGLDKSYPKISCTSKNSNFDFGAHRGMGSMLESRGRHLISFLG